VIYTLNMNHGVTEKHKFALMGKLKGRKMKAYSVLVMSVYHMRFLSNRCVRRQKTGSLVLRFWNQTQAQVHTKTSKQNNKINEKVVILFTDLCVSKINQVEDVVREPESNVLSDVDHKLCHSFFRFSGSNPRAHHPSTHNINHQIDRRKRKRVWESSNLVADTKWNETYSWKTMI